MKNLIVVLLLLGILNINCCYAKTVKVKSGTPIDFVMTKSVSSEDAVEGEKIPISVDDDVIIDGIKVFKKGDKGFLYISEVDDNAFWGRGGKIIIDRGKVFDTAGQEHRIEFIKQYAGKDVTWAPVVASLGLATIILFPLGLFGFVKGKSAKIRMNVPLECNTLDDFTFSEKL